MIKKSFNKGFFYFNHKKRYLAGYLYLKVLLNLERVMGIEPT